jgi:alcohol dehydrogenase class IV
MEDDLKKPFEAFIPVRFIAGENRAQDIGMYAKEFGNKVYLVTMKNLVEIGLVSPIIKSLKESGLTVQVFDGATSDPKVEEINRLVENVKNFAPDIMIGLGGGSCIDLAKAISLKMKQKESIWSYAGLSNRPAIPAESGITPIIAVPTTSGTGSEATPYAVLLNEETRQKGTIKNFELFPKISIIDPSLTVKLPEDITASTAIDAFAHALESYLNSGKTPFSAMFSLEAMKRIHKYLPIALKDGKNIEARYNLAWASTLAGIAIAQVGTTVTHIIAEVVGALNGFPHGCSVAIFTPPVVRRTYEHDIERFSKIAEALDPSLVNREKSINKAKMASDMIIDLIDSCNKYWNKADYDFSEKLADRIPDDLFTYKFKPIALHPKTFTKEDINEIVKEGFGL